MADNTPKKVRGIVTRSVQYKENDKIITVLTAEEGLISIYCHGAKSNKSKFLTSARLFCYSDLVITKKGDFYYLKESDYIEAFFKIVNSMDKLFLGQYFLEAINEVCIEGENQSSILRLLLNSLYALSEDVCPPSMIKAVFEMRLCSEIGVLPELNCCHFCGKQNDGTLYFDVKNGDLVCKKCLLGFEKQSSFTELSSGVLKALSPSVQNAIKYVATSKIERVFAFSLTDEAFESFFDICENYFLNQVGRSFKTLDIYNQQIKK